VHRAALERRLRRSGETRRRDPGPAVGNHGQERREADDCMTDESENMGDEGEQSSSPLSPPMAEAGCCVAPWESPKVTSSMEVEC